MTSPGLVSIAADGLTAEIDPFGAQLHSLRDAAHGDYLWNGDPAVWAGRAPILFPIVGSLNQGEYRLGQRTYCLERHGFARRRAFEVIRKEPAEAVFRLASDSETRALYPFEFELCIRFALSGGALEITASVANADRTVLPASFGFHPALRWPLPFGQPRSAHRLIFEHAEPAPVRRLDPDGLIKPDALPTPVRDRTLLLDDALFVDDALIFDRIVSRRLSYGAETGPLVQVAFPDTPYLGVWTKPGAGFICIEPWHGIADPKSFTGDFHEKPGVFLVEPGDTRRMTMSIALPVA